MYRNNQTGKALAFSSRPDNYNKIISLLGRQFEQEEDQPWALSLLMQLVIKELTGKASELEAWQKPFARFEE